MSHDARTLALIASVSLAAPASAQFTLLADQRSVSTEVALELVDPDDGTLNVFGDSDQRTPQQPFTPFTGSVLAFLQPTGTEWATGLAVQDSVSTQSVISASGFVESAVVLGPFGPGTVASSEAVSRYSLVVQIDEPQLIEICSALVSVSPSPDAGTDARVHVRFNRFDGANAYAYYGYSAQAIPAFPYYSFLRLDPGLYELEFLARADSTSTGGNPGQAEASFDAFIEWHGQPCNLADVALPTGKLDLNDITSWVNSYIKGYYVYNPTYDIVRDGIFSLNDISGFVTHFLAGCD